MAEVQSTLSLPTHTNCSFTKPQNEKRHNISSKNVQEYGTQLISTVNSNKRSSTQHLTYKADTVVDTQNREIKSTALALKELMFY